MPVCRICMPMLAAPAVHCRPGAWHTAAHMLLETPCHTAEAVMLRTCTSAAAGFTASTVPCVMWPTSAAAVAAQRAALGTTCSLLFVYAYRGVVRGLDPQEALKAVAVINAGGNRRQKRGRGKECWHAALPHTLCLPHSSLGHAC